MSKGQRFTDEFKKQIVLLFENGKKASLIVKEYEISAPTLYKWVKEFNTTGSFKTEDNLSSEQKELKKAQKRIQELEMENDILKQAALIMGRKSKL